MARTIEQEREQLAAEGRKLEERRRQLAERERSELLKEVEKSGLLKGDATRGNTSCEQILGGSWEDLPGAATSSRNPTREVPLGGFTIVLFQTSTHD